MLAIVCGFLVSRRSKIIIALKIAVFDHPTPGTPVNILINLILVIVLYYQKLVFKLHFAAGNVSLVFICGGLQKHLMCSRVLNISSKSSKVVDFGTNH